MSKWEIHASPSLHLQEPSVLRPGQHRGRSDLGPRLPPPGPACGSPGFGALALKPRTSCVPAPPHPHPRSQPKQVPSSVLLSLPQGRYGARTEPRSLWDFWSRGPSPRAPWRRPPDSSCRGAGGRRRMQDRVPLGGDPRRWAPGEDLGLAPCSTAASERRGSVGTRGPSSLHPCGVDTGAARCSPGRSRNPRHGDGVCHQLTRTGHAGSQIKLVFRTPQVSSANEVHWNELPYGSRHPAGLLLCLPPVVSVSSVSPRHAHTESRPGQQLALGSHGHPQPGGSVLLLWGPRDIFRPRLPSIRIPCSTIHFLSPSHHLAP